MNLYRVLLVLYPAGFRGEYGEELDRTFAERRRRAGGRLDLAALWLRELADLVRSAALAHLEILGRDLRFAARSLSRAPGFTATAVLVAALAIGANTAVFSVADQVFLRPLPYPEAERLVQLWEEPQPGSRNEVSPPNYRDWRDRATSFSAMSAHHHLAANLVGAAEPVRLEGVGVGADLLPMMGVEPLLGRLFTAADERPEAAGTLLLSHATWQRVFGGDREVLGRAVRVDDEPYTVIGVLPADFSFPSPRVQLWAPLRLTEDDLADRDNNYFRVVARLRPGIGIAAAQEEMTGIARQLEREHPDANAETNVAVDPLQTVLPQTRLLLLALAGASACVLLIACSNLAMLLLARALARSKELAVRVALGAGAERVARLLSTEVLLLTALGGAAGVVLALAIGPLLLRLVPPELPIRPDAGVDPRTIGFALLATLVTGAVFGLAPTFHAVRGRLEGLQERSAHAVAHRRLRSLLVGAQVAGCVLLLVACGLLLRALLRVQATDPGFRSGSVVAVETPLPPVRYSAPAQRSAVYGRVLDDVRALPGVRSAAYVTGLPLEMGGGIRPVEVPGEEIDPADRPMASLRFVSRDYFATMGIPLLAGRDVRDGDRPDAPLVAVVSESFVRRHFPGGRPLGRTFGFADAERTIVGVVGEVLVRGLERQSEPQVYLPSGQTREGETVYAPRELVVRAAGDPMALLPAVRRIVRQADPEVPIGATRRLDDLVAAQTGGRRVHVVLVGAYAALALLLAGVGIHGMLSVAVAQRRPELGLRVAVGADRLAVLRVALGRGLAAATLGCAAGLLLGVLAGRAMAGLLAGIAPADVVTLGAVAGVALLATLSGALAPALAAVRVDAARALLL